MKKSIVFIFSLFIFSKVFAQLTLKHLGVQGEKISEYVEKRKKESDFDAIKRHCSTFIEPVRDVELLYKNDTASFVYAINMYMGNIPNIHIYYSKFGSKYKYLGRISLIQESAFIVHYINGYLIILGRNYSNVIYRIYNINRSKTNHPIIVARTYLECKNSQLIEKEPFILEMTYCDGKKEIFTFDIFNEIVYSLNDKEEKIEKTKFGENKWFEIRKD